MSSQLPEKLMKLRDKQGILSQIMAFVQGQHQCLYDEGQVVQGFKVSGNQKMLTISIEATDTRAHSLPALIQR